MIKFSDNEDENGDIDWKAYNKAQVDNGEKCYKCGSLILFGSGYPSLCNGCETLRDDKGEVISKRIRCPYCKESFDPYDCEMYEVLENGEHSIECPNCDEEFEIETKIEYNFRSPEISIGRM
jgi:DNA-directed RNA polymerase subunit RPC12/RpoP